MPELPCEEAGIDPTGVEDPEFGVSGPKRLERELESEVELRCTELSRCRIGSRHPSPEPERGMNPYPVPVLRGPMVDSSSVDLRGGGVRRALFVDRDGTLNPDLHYLRDADRLELFRGVGDALALAHGHGYLVICVTNQSGVERGLYSREDVERIHQRLNDLLRPHRAHVDAFYYCPHAPETRCECRKPGTLLFRQARDEWKLDFDTSAIIGDRDLDLAAGRELGLITAVVIPPGHEDDPTYAPLRSDGRADVNASSFRNAVLRILAAG